MKLDFKNILVGIIIGILFSIITISFFNDLQIDIRLGDLEDTNNKFDSK